MSIPGVAQAYWSASSTGELLAGRIPISRIAGEYGTPLFVYSSEIIERKLAFLRKTLPSRFSIAYSIKANPHPEFLRFFIQNGCGLEIASAGEFHLATSVDCPREKIIFAGPGKTEQELRFVVEQGIGEIHAESELELQRIDAISKKVGVRTQVALRVNPDETAQSGAMQMGGKPAPFGVDEENLISVVDGCSNYGNIEVCGIHLFAGTQILDAASLIGQYKKGIDIAVRMASYLNISIKTLDFGGGLGIPYFPGEHELNLDDVRIGLKDLMRNVENQACFAHTNFIIEPGRFLVGDCGVYVVQVTDIKISRGKKYLIVDGGMNHHLAASGNLGQVIKRNFPMAVVNKLNAELTETVDIVGPLCTPLDSLGRAARVPPAEVGDLIGIFQSGAYARSASPLGFLSHPTPPEIWVEDEQQYLIRSRSNCAEISADIHRLSLPQTSC